MCTFFSAIRTKGGRLLWHDMTDSHEDMIEHFGLREGINGRNFARLEFVPKDNKYDDPAAYVLRIDEERTPEWYSTDDQEKDAEKLRDCIKKMIVRDARELLLGGRWIIAEGAAVKLAKGCTLILCGGTLTRMSGGTLTHMSGGTLTHMSGGTLTGMSGGTLTWMFDGTLTHMSGGTLTEMFGGTLTGMFGGTLTEMFGGTLTGMFGGTLTHMSGGTLTHMSGGTLTHMSGGTINLAGRYCEIKKQSSGVVILRDERVSPIPVKAAK